MDNNTRIQTEKSFLEVSRGAARNKLYALRAEQDGNGQLARLFRAIAFSEEAQALRFLLQLRGQTGKNEQNCTVAFAEEIPGLINHYEKATDIAIQAGERAMESAFSQSAKVSRIHLSLKKKLEKDTAKDSPYNVCSFCGFIMEGRVPDNCPICTAPASRFKEV